MTPSDTIRRLLRPEPNHAEPRTLEDRELLNPSSVGTIASDDDEQQRDSIDG